MGGPQAWVAFVHRHEWPSGMGGPQAWVALRHEWPSGMGGPQTWVALCLIFAILWIS